MTTPNTCLRVLSSLILTIAANARAQSFLTDPTFDTFGTPATPWEVRYGRKTSGKGTHPDWRAESATDDASPAYRTHVLITPNGPAEGSVYLGQRVRLPRTVPPGELSIDYQTFCELDERSGHLLFDIYTPAAWNSLAAVPAEAGPPRPGDLFSHRFHANRQDATKWRTGRAPMGNVAEVLQAQAGKEVVIAVSWHTWHAASLEWARFDNFAYGKPQPRIEPAGWPRYSPVCSPVVLAVDATVPEDARIELRYHDVGFDDWRMAPMQASGPGRFRAEVPATQFVQAVSVQAVLLLPDGRELHTPQETIEPMTPPSHPCVFYTPELLQSMKDKADLHDWARKVYDSVRRNADRWIERSDEPPAEGGGWSHNYTCPEDGSRLKFRESHPRDHLCPRCNKEWRADKYDAVWRSTMHGRFIGGAEDMALVYQLTGEETYGRAAVRILLWYAGRYVSLPLGTGPAGRGKVQAQSLSESSWLIHVISAADLAYSAMTPEEARHIEEDLVRACAEHCSNYTFGIHNIQCWHNAGMACAGYFLGDADMVKRATDGKLGLRRQLTQGVLSDGIWFERSLGYHNYTVRALTAHCEAARNAGDEIAESANFRRMLTAPLMLTFPDLSTPSLNDMGYSSRRIGTSALELAAGLYDDPVATLALAELYRLGAGRSSMTAWKYLDELPNTGSYSPPISADMPGAGLAILRRKTGNDALCAMLEYGEHGGGHGHPDKLQLILYGLGRPLCPDIGTTGYGNPMHRNWYKTTPGHNTLTVGGRSMAHITGRLIGFKVADAYTATSASADTAYQGCALTRRLLLTDTFLVDVFEAAGDTEDIVDWFLRAPGALGLSLDTVPLTEEPLTAPYEYLKHLCGKSTDGAWAATWTLPGSADDAKPKRLMVTLAPSTDTHVAQASAPGPAGTTWNTLQVRRKARSTRFCAVYQFDTGGQDLPAPRFTANTITIGDAAILLAPDENALLSLTE